MKFIFFGSPEFAQTVLENLIDKGYIPSALVCNPDRPVGRKKIITPPPTKERIMNYESRIKEKILILQPERLDEEFKNTLKNLEPDFFVIAAYSKIIRQDAIDIPKNGTIGVHPSLLPKYRGSSPIQSAILNGEKETGVTLFYIDEKVDHGPMISQVKTEIGNMNYIQLQKKLAVLGGKLMAENFPKLINKEIEPEIQNEDEATFTKKFSGTDGFVEFSDLETAQNIGGEIALQIHNKIRALGFEPGVWTLANETFENSKLYESAKCKLKTNTRIKLLEAEIASEGKLKLKRVQIEGKNPITLG